MPRAWWCQKWEESERGWGTRPDGFSLHLTEGDLKRFVEEYWDRMPNSVPDEYSKPDGDPYLCPVNDHIYAIIKAGKNGVRRFGTSPYPEGTNGWKSEIPPPPRLDTEDAAI